MLRSLITLALLLSVSCSNQESPVGPPGPLGPQDEQGPLDNPLPDTDHEPSVLISPDQSNDESGRAVLMALYKATGGGTDWKNDTNWGSDAPIGTWEGVTTNAAGRVTYLNLGDNRLTGTIPAELGKLTKLERIGLCATS